MTDFQTTDPAAAIRDRALALGFDAVGFAEPELSAAARDGLAEYLACGYHGDMGWLATKADRRVDPRALWPEVGTVVALGMNYGPSTDPRGLADHPDRGAISVYARGRDYHDVVKPRLGVLGRWMTETFGCSVKVFVDTAPVMEKPLAGAAGLGWQGKHTNLVSRRHGSWLFLGELYTTLRLAPDIALADHCGACRRCLDACPTAAFPAPHRLDARRCLSYLTIEHKDHIPAEFRGPMGNRVYGCDECLAVCPWNKFAKSSREGAFLPRVELTAPRLADLAALDDAGFRAVFAGSPIKRTGRDRFVRNVLIALGNSRDPAQAGVAEARLTDPSPLVRAMAVWALGRLAEPMRLRQLHDRHAPAETDDAVRAEWWAAVAAAGA